MTDTTIDVEWIVSEVLRRLREVPEGNVGAEIEKSKNTRSEVKIEDTVISLETITKQAASRGQFVVRRDAVVTPAAKDELRKRGIRLRYGDHADISQSDGSKELYVAVIGSEATPRVTRLVTELNENVEIREFGTIEQSVEELGIAASCGRLGTLWTDRPAAAICLANRDPRVWAVHGWDASSAREVVDSVKANVFVVDSRCQNTYLVRAMLKVFLSRPT